MDISPLLRTACALEAAHQGDADLVRQFVADKDEAAFAVLVRRHGAMVLSVCRRLLCDTHEAEDAMQATFIVLARKAPVLKSCTVLGDWLHGVARRIALKARTARMRRQARERVGARSATIAPEPRNDFGPLLDEQIGRLPEKYRWPLVLCDLQGKTRHDAAKQLGWPDGTVAGRLVRARAMLAQRLLRTVKVGAVALPSAVGAASEQGGFAADLVHSTVRAAVAVASNKSTEGVVSSFAVILAQRELQSMMWNKIKPVVLALLAVIVSTVAACVVLGPLAAAPGKDQDSPPAKPPEAASQVPEKKVPTERDKALLDAAQKQFDGRWREFVAGKTSADFIVPWSGKLLEATLRVCEKSSEKIEACKAHIERLKAVEEVNKKKLDDGAIAPTQYYQIVYYRIEAEIMLDEMRRRK
jgi:RNA polymerase sigma factor (sigma-70 family)